MACRVSRKPCTWLGFLLRTGCHWPLCRFRTEYLIFDAANSGWSTTSTGHKLLGLATICTFDGTCERE
ncbi:hypothetical protein RSAG8_03926, partial [Rhizoctonia solani AG-8 WAC10335]